jgi:hypothetical protein
MFKDKIQGPILRKRLKFKVNFIDWVHGKFGGE